MNRCLLVRCKNAVHLSAIACIIAIAIALPARWAQAQNSPKIIVLGDSISAAYGISEDDGWVALLQEKLNANHYKFNTINASITGETSSGGANRIASLLKRHQPRIVILELGGNDGLRGLSLKSMRKNLQQIIEKSQMANAQVLLLGMHIPPNYGTQYATQFHQIYHQLAEKNTTAFVPFLLEGVAENAELMQADGIHPGGNAQPIMLELVWPALEPLLK